MPQARQKVLRRSLLPTSQRNRRLLRPRSQIATRRKAHVSSGGGRRSATRPRQKPRRPVARRPPGASSRQRPPRAVHATAATRTLCAWPTRRGRAPSATRASQAARAATPRTASGRRARWRRRACLWRAWARTARAKRAWCALRRVCTASTCAIQSRAHGCAALTAEMLPRALSLLRMERTVVWHGGQVCFKCGQRGHWAAECTASQSLADAVDLRWCVTDTALLDAGAPPLPPILRPDAAAAQRCAAASQQDAGPSTSAAAQRAPGGDALHALLRADFGHQAFRSFQLPVVQALLQVRHPRRSDIECVGM